MYLHEGSLLVEGGSEYDSGLEGDHPLKVVRKNFYVRIFNRKTIEVHDNKTATHERLNICCEGERRAHH